MLPSDTHGKTIAWSCHVMATGQVTVNLDILKKSILRHEFYWLQFFSAFDSDHMWYLILHIFQKV